MSLTQQGSSGVSRKGSRIGQNRRTWSMREEEVLIAVIRDLIAHGWKSDNGFRAGYLGRLEEAMKREFRSTDLKGSPHINSKISSWKKTFASLCGILSRSGVGFNARENFMIDVEDDTWESIVKVDPMARTMRYKQWPYYDVWLEIFGRDRATGYNAEDIVDAVNDIAGDGESHQTAGGATSGDNGEQNPLDPETQTSNSQTYRVGGSTSSREKKRKLSRDVQEVCAVLDRIGRSADARLDSLAGKFGYDFELDQKKKQAFDCLAIMDFLSTHQRFRVCELLAKENDKLQVFCNLSAEMRPSYVNYLLQYLNI